MAVVEAVRRVDRQVDEGLDCSTEEVEEDGMIPDDADGKTGNCGCNQGAGVSAWPLFGLLLVRRRRDTLPLS